MKTNISFLLSVILLTILFSNGLFAQEYLTGITHNAIIAKQAKTYKPTKDDPAAVKLPFIEDFSNYTGYPNPKLWIDRQAFVNNTYPICPPTIGVATLDAIDENGMVYAHANNEGFAADTLTSVRIRLDSNFTLHRSMRPSDSLYFSFYYQPGGGRPNLSAYEWERIGDGPESDDELILEFGYATGNVIFIGFEFADYIIGENESYVTGDTMDNPFIPGTYYIFENSAYPGQTIQIPSDSLFGPEYVWNKVWSTEGCRLDDWLAENPLQYFKQVLIPITDEQYLRNNFQFRFRNMASLDLAMVGENAIVGWASNCDQWNIDYIRLNTDRNINDLYPNDVAFVSPTTTALNGYQAMPWNQYRPENMATNFHNDLSNLAASTKNTFYNYKVVKNHATEIYASTVNNENAEPYYPNGLHQYANHATPSINFNYAYDGADSALFTITHIFRLEGANDECLHNDSCVFEQKFYNYYAYDDGTAEAGYSLLSTMAQPKAYLAVRFNLAEPDTLRCVNMWFNQTLNDESVAPFTLMVWADNEGLPGDVLYEMPAQLPTYKDDYLDFATYYLEEPLPVTETFYVGFYQSHDVQLNLGFDQNNDARENFLYKVSNEWKEPFLRGAPMVRPVLGKNFDHSGIAQQEKTEWKVYPNPTDGLIHIENNGDTQHTQYQIFDIYGRLLEANSLNDNKIDIQQYPTGIYILKIMEDNQTVTTNKIIKK